MLYHMTKFFFYVNLPTVLTLSSEFSKCLVFVCNRHHIAEILLKVALNTIKQTHWFFVCIKIGMKYRKNLS